VCSHGREVAAGCAESIEHGGSMREDGVAVLASGVADHTRGRRGVGTGAAGDAGLSDELEWFVNGGSGSVTKWRRRCVMEGDATT